MLSLKPQKNSPWVNPLSANFTKWSNTLKQFVGRLPANCLSVFDHFVGLLLRGLMPDSGHASFEYSWRFLNVLNTNFNFT